jgi:uncharacterized protein (TIGR02145 family)
MKSTAFSIFLFLFLAKINAQFYLVDFTGTGESTQVDSVKVENLSQCTSLALSGSDTLRLITTTGIDDKGEDDIIGIRISPNPFGGNCSFQFSLASDNMIYLNLTDLSGKVVLRQSKFLTAGNHTFHLDGLRRGTYSLIIRTDDYMYSAKLVSCATANSNPSLKYAGSTGANGNQLKKTSLQELKEGRNVKSVISMQFNEGDTLKLTGKSGIYRTVVMLFPDQSQTVLFNFLDCTDADNNHYAVVQIGSQYWMQENLKTTRYLDGSTIQNVPDSAMWAGITSGAWCDYHNDPAEGAYYGHLYNYFAIADSRKICPPGWHVSSNAEWNLMEKFLDNTVDTTALMGTGMLIGRILKEGCETRWQQLDSTAGWNSAGFTALCSNFRTANGGWSLAPDDNHDDSFWTATPYNENMAWNKSLRWCTSDIYNIFNFNRAGSSVRCIKDD